MSWFKNWLRGRRYAALERALNYHLAVCMGPDPVVARLALIELRVASRRVWTGGF